jgi:hypothetical protein
MRPSRRVILLVSLVLVTLLAWMGVSAYRAIRDEVCRARTEANQRELRYHILELIKDNPGDDRTLPPALDPEALVQLESGRQISVRELLTDSCTGQVMTYRAVTRHGEIIRFDASDQKAGQRVVAWTPTPDHKGYRMVLTDSLITERVPDASLDLDEQRIRSP